MIMDYLKYILKAGTTAKIMATKPAVALVAIPAAALPLFSIPQKAVLLLGALFVADFITGIGASWSEFKKEKQDLPVVPAHYLIQSAKLRLSAVKFITYALGIICAWGLEWVFVLESFNVHLSSQKLSLTSIVTAFFCTIEFYSILFENIKRMGFDLLLKIKEISRAGWDVFNTLKNNNDPETNKPL